MHQGMAIRSVKVKYFEDLKREAPRHIDSRKAK